MRSDWKRVGPESKKNVLNKRQKAPGRRLCEDRVRIRVMLLQAMEYEEPPEAGRGQKGFSPRAFEGSMALPTP